MTLIVIVAFLSLIALASIHEFGHFILAKKFGVKVEEFGIGYPPKIIWKKFGQTIYSINLLPFGAFVRIYGQEKRINDPQSFHGKPIWQRMLIILGGVVSFWIVAVVLLSIVMAMGSPTVIGDEASGQLVDPKVQIVSIAPGSPAEKAGLKIGDIIKDVRADSISTKIEKVSDIQAVIEDKKGVEVFLMIQRGKKISEIQITPRISPPQNEGPLGVALVRTALKSYHWYQAPYEGVKATGVLTWTVISGWYDAILKLIQKQPTGIQIVGPVGIFGLFTQVGQMGPTYFLQFIAAIAIFMALFNILPIPALDGGWFLFLVIEKIRGRAVSEKIERGISVFFFSLLIILMVWVTIKDFQRVF